MPVVTVRSTFDWRIWMAAFVLLVGSGASVFGRAGAQEKCAGAKTKASTLAVSAQVRCQAKAASKGIAVDGKCLQKAESKLRARFAKVDSKGEAWATPTWRWRRPARARRRSVVRSPATGAALPRS
jgi:hypothetical protein